MKNSLMSMFVFYWIHQIVIEIKFSIHPDFFCSKSCWINFKTLTFFRKRSESESIPGIIRMYESIRLMYPALYNHVVAFRNIVKTAFEMIWCLLQQVKMFEFSNFFPSTIQVCLVQRSMQCSIRSSPSIYHMRKRNQLDFMKRNP